MSFSGRFRILVLVGCLCGPIAALGQQPKLLYFTDLKGKIVSMSGDIVRWTDASQAEMYVQLNRDTKIQVLGEAEPSFLTPGLFVRFKAEISRRGQIVDDISELTIFTPADNSSVGVREEAPGAPKATTVPILVAGQITENKNGQYTIVAGENEFRFRLADEPEIKLDVADLSIVRPDDDISITGGGEAKDQIIAKGIKIELAAPLAGAVKKGKRPTAKRPARNGRQSTSERTEDAEGGR